MKIDPHIREELKKYLEHKIVEQKKRVIIISPYTLSPQEIETIIALFPYIKESELVNRVDREILAGVIIRFGTKVIDLSLASQLKNLQQSFHEIN